MIGFYTFENNSFVPHGDMEVINTRLASMRMLAGSTETDKGSFYLDPTDGSFWHYVQHENYYSELNPVTREFISQNFPKIDFKNQMQIKL